MSMSERNDRSDRLARRLDNDSDESETDEERAGDAADGAAGEDEQSSASTAGSSSEPSKTGKTDMPGKTGTPNPSVKDRPSVLMYLPAALRQEMDIRFDEVNAAAKREFGEGLEKNRHWYPLLLSLALEKTNEMSAEELLTRLDETEF
jgi:hypothetical protein